MRSVQNGNLSNILSAMEFNFESLESMCKLLTNMTCSFNIISLFIRQTLSSLPVSPSHSPSLHPYSPFPLRGYSIRIPQTWYIMFLPH